MPRQPRPWRCPPARRGAAPPRPHRSRRSLALFSPATADLGKRRLGIRRRHLESREAASPRCFAASPLRLTGRRGASKTRRQLRLGGSGGSSAAQTLPFWARALQAKGPQGRCTREKHLRQKIEAEAIRGQRDRSLHPSFLRLSPVSSRINGLACTSLRQLGSSAREQLKEERSPWHSESHAATATTLRRCYALR